MARILVTGGAGFLGSNLTSRLLSEGHQVVVVDDFSTGSRNRLAPHPHLTVLEADVSQPLDLEVEEIYHLACPASPPHYQRDQVKTLDTNYLGTRNVLELARRTAASVLFTSTSEVYGDPQIHPQSEGYWGHVNSFGPRSCYDEGKRVAESLCYAYSGRGDVKVRIARIFNTYGPGMDPDDGRVVSNFLVQALRGQALTLYGDGSQTRSLCYVDDLIEGLIRLMHAPGGYREAPCNLGNPEELTVAQIARLALEISGSQAPLEHRPLPQDDPRQRCPDISRARDWLGWAPRISARQGLERTCDYFRQQLRESSP